MLIVHHLEYSRSHRILWLLEELGVPYEICTYKRNRLTLQAPAELKNVHPLGKSPVVTDGQLTIAESGHIIQYVLDKYGNGRLRPPAGSAEGMRFDYWLHYAEGSLMPMLVLALIFQKIETTKVPFFVKPVIKGLVMKVRNTLIGPQLKLHLDYLESELAKTGWFAGAEFSAADIQMSYPVEAARSRAGLSDERPNLLRYLEKIQERPAYRRAMTASGDSPGGLASLK